MNYQVANLQLTPQGKDKIAWAWRKGAATSKTDFGNPVTATPSYEVCVYDSSASPQPLYRGSVAAGGTCGTRACWTDKKTGYGYRNTTTNADGIQRVTLKSGVASRSVVQVTAKGINLTPPDPMLTLPVTVQLMIDNGSGIKCFQTDYTVATMNDTEQFRAKGP